jgi:tryptophan-rich sensory protein
VFVARGAGPFYLAYGSSLAQSAAASLTMLPKNLAIVPASLSSSELSGGESLLQPLVAPFPWKTPLLWTVLIAGAGLLAWMAYRLSKDVARK